MKFSLDRTTALTALTAVQQAVSPGGTIPILKNVLLQAADGILDITGTNMDIQVRHTVPDVRIEADGAITVDAGKLRDCVASLAEGADFMFEFEPDEAGLGRASLKSGRAKFSMVTLPARDFPLLDEDGGAAGFTLSAAALTRLFAIGGACAVKEAARPYLNGLFLHQAANGALRAVSTDTKRMSWADKPSVGGINGWAGVILASPTVDVVGRLLRNEAPDAAITVDAGQSRIRFGIGRSTVVSKVIGGKYVPYERVIPATTDATLTGDTDLISGALDRALVMMDGQTQSVTLTFGTTLSFSTRADSAGELFDAVDVAFDGEPRKLNVNGHFLRDLLSRIRTESVVFRLTDNPCIITINETGESDMFSFMAPQHG